MVRMKRWTVTAVLAAALALPATAFATTAGYFELGFSSKNDGLAGAGVALPEDSMAQATNPAGISFVGSRFDIGAAGFWAYRGYSNQGTGFVPNSGGFNAPTNYVGSNTDFFLIPHMGVTYSLGGGSSVGAAVYGNGGMDTNYQAPPPHGPGGGPFFQGQTGVNFKQMFVQASYAYKFTRHDSVGLGLMYVRQYFSAAGLSTFAGQSQDPLGLSNNGVDMATGFGLKLGTQVRIVRGLDFGLSWTPEIHMSRFNSYQGLFADHGDFDIPESWIAGLAFKPTRHQAIAFDFQRTYFGGIPTIGNSGANINQCFAAPGPTNPSCLGGESGPGFGWKDISVYKLGYQVASSRQWTWRVGFAYNTEPVDPTQLLFNTLAPGVIQRDVAAGFTYHASRAQDFTVAAQYGLNKRVYWSGAATTVIPTFGSPTYVYLHEYQVDANWGVKF
ncbi:MAG: OmpP1/FadL family transporter [Acidobacteriaceae bacterium]